MFFSKISLSTVYDKDLVKLYQDTTDSRYFDELYRRHKSNVYGKCLSMLNDKALSDDALQDIFLKVLLNISKFSFKSKFSTWLYSITYNHCLDVIRKEVKLSKNNNEFIENIAGLVIDDDSAEEFLLNMKVNRLKVVLDNIPQKDKVILLMKYQGGLSIKELSKMLGKSESAIKMTLKRAKEKSVKKYNELFKE